MHATNAADLLLKGGDMVNRTALWAILALVMIVLIVPAVQSQDRFTDNGDGTVTDNFTGLMWEQSPDTAQKNWSAALYSANDSTLAGHDDWRLPNYYELATLFCADETYLYSWMNAHGFSNALNGAYWCSTYTPIGGTPFAVALLTTDGADMVGFSDPAETAFMRSLIVRGTAQ